MLDFLVQSGDISSPDGLMATWYHRANSKEEMNKALTSKLTHSVFSVHTVPYTGPSTRRRALKLQRFCPITLNGVTSHFAELHCGRVARFKS